MRYIIILLAVLLITSCEKVVDIDIPESEKKIVVNGIFKADSIISIHLSKSMNILDPIKWYDLPVIENADLNISSDNGLLNINYLDKGFYISDERVLQGGRYSVLIDAPPLQQVSAEIEVPDRIEITSVDTSSFYGKTYTLDSGLVDIIFYEARLKFKDPGDVKNYYIISCKVLYDHIFIDTNIYKIEQLRENPNLILLFGDTVKTLEKKFVFSGAQISINEVFADEGLLLTDDIFNGKEIEISVIFEPDKMAISQLEYYFSIISIGEDYYKYIISKQKADQSNGPFSHPVQVLCNIENGYGILAGCAESIDSLIFQQEEIDRFRYTSLEDFIDFLEGNVFEF
ncbi:MAG: DUF4249 domain-containing protein [Bacteroidales bacterium]|nr:DUF4249 domain-containing protein [Bacteroidales bacterium]